MDDPLTDPRSDGERPRDFYLIFSLSSTRISVLNLGIRFQFKHDVFSVDSPIVTRNRS